MKKTNPPGGKKRIVILLCLLAVLCIGVAELVACYFFAPALYQQITQPVRDALHMAADQGRQAVAALSARWEALTAPEPEPELPEPDIQSATEPVIEHHVPILDPSITELVMEDGREILTDGILPIVYFNQGDELWSELPYGSDNIGRYGCGPVAMAMIAASLAGADTDPAQMAELAVDLGYWARRSGSYLSIVPGLAQEYGLQAEAIHEVTPEAVEEALLSGKLLVALMGPGHFTKGGHFILLRGITLSGSLLVADPNSEERSLKEWDPQLILEELSSSTSHGGPLWVVGYP